MADKFTAGPWRAIDRRPVSGNWASRIPFAIEHVPPGVCGVAPIADVCDQPNVEANATLIAASPDLLAALRKAEQFIANGIDLGFIRMPDADTPDPAHEALPTIRAAIAKAEGRAV